MKIRFLWVVLILPAAAGTAHAEDYYFLMVFGAQEDFPRPNQSHTFATFVHATAEGPCPEWFTIVECHTISWLAETMVVRTLAPCAEPGANFELHESIRWALSTCQRVSLWGPYQIEKDLYLRALRQIDVLESGRVRYKVIDLGRRIIRVSNCRHAVSGVVGTYRRRVCTLKYGETASYIVTRRMQPWIIDTEHRHDWLASALCLDQYPIIHRDLVNPHSSLFWSILKLLAHVPL